MEQRSTYKLLLALISICSVYVVAGWYILPILREHNFFYLSFKTSGSASTDEAMPPMTRTLLPASETNQNRTSNKTMKPMSFLPASAPNQNRTSNDTKQLTIPLPASVYKQESTSSDTPTTFQVHEWKKLPNFVCMKNARFFTTKNVVRNNFSDGGGFMRYRINLKPPSGPVIWRSTLLIARFSCEGNLHHLMTETLHSILSALERMNTSDSDDLPLVAICAKSGLRPWKANQSGCHGATFYPLFNALDIGSVLFSIDNFDTRGSVPKDKSRSENVYPAPNKRWQLKNIYCFRNTQHVPSGARTASLAPRLLSWSGCNPKTSPG
jgi:hypothetical protein